MSEHSRIEHLPVSFFAMVMGLAGLAIAWEAANHTFNMPINLGGAIAPFPAIIFCVLAALYTLKLVRYRPAVIKELHHPIKLNFFPSISISLILLSIVVMKFVPILTLPLWAIGTAMHLSFTLYVMNVWIHHEHFEIHHMNPAWFIPVVGNVLVPISGTSLGYTEISWFFFSIGILFWLVLFTIIFYRILLHAPLPAKLMPTLFILIAPPAVGFISYLRLTGEVDAFARVLFYSGLFLTLLLLTQFQRFRKLKFFLSWWAYSFPLAAITVATLQMYQHTQAPGFAIVGWALLSLLTILVAVLLYQTAKAVNAGQICQPEE